MVVYGINHETSTETVVEIQYLQARPREKMLERKPQAADTNPPDFPHRTGRRFPAYRALNQEAVSGRRLFEFEYYITEIPKYLN